MENLLKSLKVTETEYENIVFQNWFNWCGRQSLGLEPLQSLTANTSLFNWWKIEYAKFEQDFMIEIAPYKNNISKKDAYLQYVRNVHKIQLYYSKPLISQAKKTNITNLN